ncbi:MAG: hypothetical protein Q8J62_03805, partial [Candidatus Cloacimonadaceae bacterium]|nr:hypothetical protein [Candidatus Cloacimonadaceae bacterium]
MKQNLVIILFLAFVLGTFSVAHAQLSGTIDIGTEQTYTTLAEAISALNTHGVGVPGVTLNLLAGTSETSPNGGYSITTLTGASDRPIVIRGNSNIITAPTTHTVGAINDAIFKIIGGDWITIEGFDMREHAATPVYAAASNNMTEFGIALFYASATNGCKNITIQNNTITLDRLYQNSFGIYSSSRHTATAMTTAADITSVDGANDNLKIYSNNISNVNMGIIVVGSLTGTLMAPGLDIGGSGVGTANTISNFGNTGTFSGYISVSGSVNGILINNQQNFNVSYNQITSSIGGTIAGTLRGIYVQTTGTLPTTGSFTRTILYNNVSVRSAVAAGAMVGIANEGGNLTTTIDINYNNFHTTTHTLAATGAITFISQTGACQTQRVLDNTFTNINMNTTGAVILINTGNSMPASGVQNINYNRIVGTFTKTVAGGNLTGIVTNSSSPAGSNSSMTYNNFSNITVSGTSVVTGIQNTDGGSPNKTITFNTFENWAGGTGLLNPLNINYNGASSISDNLINNIVGTGAVTGILIGSSAQSSPAVTIDVARNTVQTLMGTGTVTGISSACPASVTNIFRNSVKDLTGNGTAGLSYGLVVTGGAIHNVYNNVICNLKAPDNTGTVASINTIRLTGGTTKNISYNTTYLDATGSSANFSTASLFISAGDNTLLNNIFVNKSVPGSTGRTVVIWKSTAGNANIGAGSATNIYHAGDERENQLIGYFVA